MFCFLELLVQYSDPYLFSSERWERWYGCGLLYRWVGGICDYISCLWRCPLYLEPVRISIDIEYFRLITLSLRVIVPRFPIYCITLIFVAGSSTTLYCVYCTLPLSFSLQCMHIELFLFILHGIRSLKTSNSMENVQKHAYFSFES